MSIRTQAWLWEHSPAKGGDLLLLLALADFGNDEGSNAWPSVETLADKCRTDRRTVQRMLSRLRDRGLIAVLPNAGPGGVNRYRLVMVESRNGAHVKPYRPGGITPPRQNAAMVETPLPPAASEPSAPVVPVPPEPSVEPSVEPPGTSLVTGETPFDAFWSVYPLKVKKAAAKKAFAKALKTTTAKQIIAGAVFYRDDPNRTPAYTAHPSSWLNDGRWDDDPLPARGRPPGRMTGDEAAASGLALVAKYAALEGVNPNPRHLREIS